MKILKEGVSEGSGELSQEDLGLINRLSRKTLSGGEVFTFSLILCDNEVDRDFERFDEPTLAQLGELFVGKTGISDHEWSSARQVARIFKTELVKSPERRTSAGEQYVCLKAWAYMLRTRDNETLIAEIQGGIKKETSVGCSVSESVCSICGGAAGECGHVKGEEYAGRLCHAVLRGAVDAYEWSFVAVPAQRGAGVTKAFSSAPGAPAGLKGFVESRDGRRFAAEFEALDKQAQFGRQCLNELRGEVLRLCLLCDRQMYGALSRAAGLMEAEELGELKAALERRAAERLPLKTQLPGTGEAVGFDGGEYSI